MDVREPELPKEKEKKRRNGVKKDYKRVTHGRSHGGHRDCRVGPRGRETVHGQCSCLEGGCASDLIYGVDRGIPCFVVRLVVLASSPVELLQLRSSRRFGHVRLSFVWKRLLV
jgi:hypothetical protein